MNRSTFVRNKKSMPTRRLLLTFLALACFYAPLKSQTYVMIQGSVYNLAGESMVGAHARNQSKGYGTFTDYTGKFTLVLAESDTLKVSMIGYKAFTIKIPGKLDALNYSLKITLLVDTVHISGPEIRAYPATYPEFRKEFIALRTPEEIMHKKLDLPTTPFRRKYENPGGGLLLPGPVGLLYNKYSKEAKEKKKMDAIFAKNKLRFDFLNIFAPEILDKRYGCSGEDDIDALLEFCGIDTDYLKRVPHYLIADRLDRCGKEWKRRRK